MSESRLCSLGTPSGASGTASSSRDARSSAMDCARGGTARAAGCPTRTSCDTNVPPLSSSLEPAVMTSTSMLSVRSRAELRAERRARGDSPPLPTPPPPRDAMRVRCRPVDALPPCTRGLPGALASRPPLPSVRLASSSTRADATGVAARDGRADASGEGGCRSGVATALGMVMRVRKRHARTTMRSPE